LAVFFRLLSGGGMPRIYNKQPLTFVQQIQKLIERGVQIVDPAASAARLASISYYRLSGYSYPFRQRNEQGTVLDAFTEGTTWEKILALYDFDRELRLLVLDAIERIEVAVRTQLTYHFSHKYGPFGHVNGANFHPSFNHADWLDHIQKETTRSSDEFIRHYRGQYQGFPTIPLWMLTEVMSLGLLSRLYRGLQHADKRPIAQHFNVHYKRLQDWLHALTYVRNVCAHHSRLWNRELSIRPDDVRDRNWRAPITPRNDRVFYILLILRHLLNGVGSGMEWARRVNQLLRPIAESRQWRAAMGLPEHWEEHPIWQCRG
jgi:abortive infection bacteriophage resistance protein